LQFGLHLAAKQMDGAAADLSTLVGGHCAEVVMSPCEVETQISFIESLVGSSTVSRKYLPSYRYVPQDLHIQNFADNDNLGFLKAS